MKTISFFTLVACSLLAINTFAATIVNGDFATGDFSGWNKDTDGAGDISTGNDFSIVGSPGNFSAAIEVDAFDPPGDFTGNWLDDVLFANTLFQQLDLSAAANSTFLLNIDFDVNSQITSADPFFIPDVFAIGLNDGTGNFFDGTGAAGFLSGPTDINGLFNYNLSFALDNSFVNQIGWFLDVQVAVGLDNSNFSDSYASTLLLNSVSLIEVEGVTVSEPASALIFSLGLAGLLIRRKKLAK